MLPALLSAAALLVSLLAQASSSAFAGAWLPFHLAACAMLLYRNTYSKQPFLWSCLLAWLLTIFVSSFFIAPMVDGSYWMWVLAAMPMLALCLQEKDLTGYVIAFGAMLTLYACVLAVQHAAGANWSAAPYAYGTRSAWPMLDPNNAAAMMNIGLLPALYLMMFKDLRWGILTMLFAYALYATGSRTGLAAGALGATILCACRYGWDALVFIIGIGVLATGLVFEYRPEAIADASVAFQTRYAIWQAAIEIIRIHPLRGSGMGSFAHYFLPRAGGTYYNPPSFVHNDVLQVAVEMGIPAATIFAALALAAMAAANRRNLPTTCVILAVFVQSMLEFQFYLPALSIAMGLVMAYHVLHRRRGAFD